MTNTIFMNIEQASEFLGISKSTLYKKSMKNLIPKYRPGNGKLLFKTEDLIKFIEGFRISSADETSADAERVLNKMKGGK